MNQRTNRMVRILITAFAALALTSPSAWAGAGSVPDAGATRVGMYAAIGKVTDPTAIFHNVANIAATEGTDLHISSLLVYPIMRYKLETDPQTDSYSDSVTPIITYAAFPYLGFASNFGLKNLRFGIANYSPNLSGGIFDENGPARYHLVKGFFVTNYTSLAAAAKIAEGVYFGGAIDFVYARQSGYRKLSLFQTAPPPYNAMFRDMNDLKVIADMDDWAIGYHFGILYVPTPEVRFGVSYFEQNNFSLAGDFTMKTTGGQTIPILNIQKFRTATRQTMLTPRTIKLGFNFIVNPKWNWGVDFYWWDYSKLEKTTQTFPGIDQDPVGALISGFIGKEVVMPKNYTDSFQVAAGAEHTVNDKWKVRFGMQYDDSPIPNNTFSLDAMTSDLIGIAASAEYAITPNNRVALGLQHVHMFPRTIHDSITDPATNVKLITTDVEFLLLEWNYRF